MLSKCGKQPLDVWAIRIALLHMGIQKFKIGGDGGKPFS
jgi:hypothetical protein